MKSTTQARSTLPWEISPRLEPAHLLAAATIAGVHVASGGCTSLVHLALVTCLIPLTLHAIHGTKGMANQRTIQILLAAGLALLVAVVLAQHLWALETRTALTVLGTVLILTGHIKNRRI